MKQKVLFKVKKKHVWKGMVGKGKPKKGEDDDVAEGS